MSKEKVQYLESISLDEINRDKCYFNPGCALTLHNKEAVDKMLLILNKYFGPVKLHSICCHNDPGLPKGSTIINNCAGCDRRFRSLYEGINTISLWEVLDQIEDLELPQYEDLTVSVHDSCSYRLKPQVHSSLRSILRKMNISIEESEFSGTNSICCGDNLFGKVPLEQVHEFQKRRAAQMPCDDVVVYCVSCIKSMSYGGKTPRYMMDLVLNEKTYAKEMDLEKYHNEIMEYIKNH